MDIVSRDGSDRAALTCRVGVVLLPQVPPYLGRVLQPRQPPPVLLQPPCGAAAAAASASATGVLAGSGVLPLNSARVAESLARVQGNR